MKKLLFLAAGLLCLAGCAPKPLYTWGKYQDASHKYVKNNTEKDADALIKTYQYIIDHPKNGKRQVAPPGICADYGFLLVQKGRVEEGLKLMRMEIALYPESAVFVEAIIKKLEQ